jgi:metallo-beta-lactamase family protein
LGHRLLLGLPSIHIKGKEKQVFAQIARTDVYSSHPDHDEVFSYINRTAQNAKAAGKKLKKVFLVHGEEPQLMAMKKSVDEMGGVEAIIPNMLQDFKLHE